MSNKNVSAIYADIYLKRNSIYLLYRVYRETGLIQQQDKSRQARLILIR